MGKDKNILYLGNLRCDLPITDLKNNLLELFCNYIGVDVQWSDIDIKKGRQAWFAFVDLHDEGEASETLEELASWENRRNLRYNFTYIVPPYESLAVDYKKVKKVKKSKKQKETGKDAEDAKLDKAAAGASSNNNAEPSQKSEVSDGGDSKQPASGKDSKRKSGKGKRDTKKVLNGSGNVTKGGEQNGNSPTTSKPKSSSSPKKDGSKSDDKDLPDVSALSLEKNHCSTSTSTTDCPVSKSGAATSTTGLATPGRNYTQGQFLGAETRNREYKLGGGNYTKKSLKEHVCKYVCGFLNSGQEGTLMIGVNDSGNVTGVECGQAQEDDARLTIDQAIKTISPAIFPNMYSVEFIPVVTGNASDTDLRIIEVTVNAVEHTDFLYSTNRDMYVRRDGSIQGPLKGMEIQEWTRQRHQKEIRQLREQVRRQEERLLLQEERHAKTQSKVCTIL